MAWLGTWANRVKVTIDHNDISAALVWFPVLLHLSATCGKAGAYDLTPIFDEVGVNSKKIAVTKADGITQLYAEIEGWDSVAEIADLWVSRDGWAIDNAVDTDFYIYYDNTQPDNTTWVNDTNTAQAEAVWDDDFVLVCHMPNDPDTTHIRDSTKNDNDGTKRGANSPTQVAGRIGLAQDFHRTADQINMGADATLEIQKHLVEYWMNIETMTILGTECRPYQKFQWATSGYFTVYDGWNIKHDIEVPADKYTQIGAFNAWVAEGDWHHYYDLYDGINLQMGIDSVQRSTNNVGAQTVQHNNAINLTLGITNWCPEAIIDEFRISKDDRSPAYRTASYETQRDELLDYGSVELYVPPDAGLGGVTGIMGFIYLEEKQKESKSVLQ